MQQIFKILWPDRKGFPAVLMFILLLGFSGYGQEITVSGTVTGAMDGIPFPGVNVIQKGTSNGVVTNMDGEFSIQVSPEAVLVFSYVGFKEQEVQVNGRNQIDVQLAEDLESLDDVIVVGYGTQKKATLTGSVSNIKGEDLMKSQAVNVSTSLAGRLPGLSVNQRSGAPGNEALDITIRGVGTFGDNNPLIIIDGVPREGVLERLNPADIESISVLKDGSAAIYGARAANGVILVTTKKGTPGETKFSLSYNYGITNPTKLPDMMDAALFAEVYNEAEFYRQGRPETGFEPFYSQEAIERYRDGSDPILYANTNWPAVALRDNTPQQRLNFQASGGSEKITYLLSYAGLKQEGNFINQPDNYKQHNIRVNVQAALTDDLTVGANISGIFQDRENSTGADFVSTLQANPTLVAVYPNGLIAPGRFNNNPLLSNRTGLNTTSNIPINSTFTASYEVPFLKGLALDASFNYDLRNQFQKNFSQPYEFHQYNVQTEEYDLRRTEDPVQLTNIYFKETSVLTNFRISYKTLIAYDHSIDAMLGTEQQKRAFSSASAYRRNFVSPAIRQIDAGSTDPDDKNNSGTAWENAYNNFFGRVNYNFKSKYLLEFVFRYDGSPIFPEGNRYGFFPGVSAGWRISKENFMADVSWVDELKLRASYGEMGNDRVSPYQFMQTFQFGNNYVFGGSDAPGIYSSTLPNANITWEVSKKFDVGLFAELWDGLFSADFTVFKEKRSNLLLQRSLSVSHLFGFPALPSENIGEVENSGFELQLSHQHSVGDFNYAVGGNVAYAKSNIIFMDEVPPAEPYQTQTGRPIGSGLYYKSDGIFNTQEELDNYPHGQGAQVGDIKVLDLNNDGQINGDDRYRANNSAIPEYVFGLSTDFSYKGFDLALFFQGQTNAYINDGTLNEFGLQDQDNATVFRATNRWTVDNQLGATMPRANDWQPGTTDFFLYDATFVRLKNLEIGYTLPANLLSGTGILEDIRIYANGTNLYTWAKEITYMDPEMVPSGDSGGTFTNYPPLRVLSVGAHINF